MEEIFEMEVETFREALEELYIKTELLNTILEYVSGKGDKHFEYCI